MGEGESRDIVPKKYSDHTLYILANAVYATGTSDKVKLCVAGLFGLSRLISLHYTPCSLNNVIV